MIIQNYDPQKTYSCIQLELPIGLPFEEAFQRRDLLLKGINAVLLEHDIDDKGHFGTDYGLGVPDSEAHMLVYAVVPEGKNQVLTALEETMKSLEPGLTPERIVKT
jgi:hypothetical protein